MSIYQSDVVIKTTDGYVMKPSYVRAMFDIKLLPLNVILPMVHPPFEIKDRSPVRAGPDDKKEKRRLASLTGGYLYSDPKIGSKEAPGMCSHNKTNFDIRLQGDAQTRQLTSVLNKLQAVPFQINRIFLQKINDEWDQFQKFGLVLPKILSSINRRAGLRKLHELYMKDDDIQENFTYRELSKILIKNITEANYQQYILLLADAYQSYFMYFPCYMDFRGRNYRYGPFHFHERDLVRSLIVFGDPGDLKEDIDYSEIGKNHVIATAYHFIKNIANYSKAYEFTKNLIEKYKLLSPDNDPKARDDILYGLAHSARNPFQFLSFFQMMTTAGDTSQDSWYYILRAPHQLDASASAYQLISYFLIDLKMARETNLFVDDHTHDYIHDIYQSIETSLKDFIPKYKPKADDKSKEKEDKKSKVKEEEKSFDQKKILELISTLFDRKIVKKIFMPIVYGKTQFSAAKELREQIGRYTSNTDISDITKVCFQYWETEFVGMKNLMRLVASISWVAAANQQSVILSNKYWETRQDYFVNQPVRVTLRYKPNIPRAKSKRAAVTLRVPTGKRNTRKSASATFANFIHQKDGLIALNFIHLMMNIKKNPGLQNLDFSKAPIYTVHDNFVTTPLYAKFLPYFYRRAVRLLGHPITIINKLIYDNIIAASPTEGAPTEISVELEALRKNYSRCDPTDSSPISEETLEYCLISLRKDIHKRSKAIEKDGGEKLSLSGWKDRAGSIIYSYKDLVKTISTPQGDKRWKTFCQCLDRHYDPRLNEYSLHY